MSVQLLSAGALALVLLGACGSTPTAQPLPPDSRVVKAITAEDSKACKYLDDVIAVSSRYGVFAKLGIDSTRAEVLDQARQLGATAVVWGEPVLVYGSTTSKAKAYRCD